MSCGGNCTSNASWCSNPCGVTEENTTTCESLPSQIQNFTEAFFGTVVKTEVDGEVVWNLPCDLDVGLPNNPRAADEGLACYFLRLFDEGITGLTGPKGDTGPDGADGKNAFGVTLQSFTQPTIASPNVNILTAYNPCLTIGLYVYIQSSGWYQIYHTDGAGGVWLTLILSSGATADGGTVTAGKLVIPSGTPGAQGIQGVQGIQGIQGPAGAAGATYTVQNQHLNEDNQGATQDFEILTGGGSVVDFSAGPAGTENLELDLPGNGIYLISYVVTVLANAPGAAATNTVWVRNEGGGGSDVPGSFVEHYTPLATTKRTFAASFLYRNTDGAMATIKVKAKTSGTSGQWLVSKTHFSFGYVLLSP